MSRSNSLTTDYGEGVAVAYFPIGETDASLQRLLNHEANGHGFGKLADEYYYNQYVAPGNGLESLYEEMHGHQDRGWFRNISTTTTTTDPYFFWDEFIEDTDYTEENIGVYEGANTYIYHWWRPTNYSIMRDNVGGFNAPSRKFIYYRINKLAYGNTWTYDHATFKNLDMNWIVPSRSLSARSIYEEDPNFVPLGRPVVQILDDFGNVIERYE